MMEDEIYNENLVDDPDDLERIIEGENDTERGNTLDDSDNDAEEGNGGDEKENDEEKKKVEPKRKRTLNPQPRLNVDRLKGPRGIGILESFFQDVKLKGKGHEKEDLDVVMGRLEHWVHRLFPRFKFDDCLNTIEKLGTRKPIQNHVKRIRLGMEDEGEPMSTEQIEESPLSPPMVDPFDELIGHRHSQAPTQPLNLNTEQRDRMLRNRMIAEERRMARMKAQHEKQRLQNESSAFPVELSPMEEHSSSILDNKRNSLDVQVDEDLRSCELVNTNFDGIENKQTSIPMLEDRDHGTTSSQIKDAELNNTDILPVKESEVLFSDQTPTEDATCTFIKDKHNEKSIMEAQRERMLQNKRRAEELRKAKLGNSSQKQAMNASIETSEREKSKNIIIQDLNLDHKENDIIIENPEKTSGENIVHDQKLHCEIIDTNIKNTKEKNGENILEKILDHEVNYTHIENPDGTSCKNIIVEKKLYNETTDSSIEISEEEMGGNIDHKQIFDHESNGTSNENPEVIDDINIEKFHHKKIDPNIDNSEEWKGENIREQILDHKSNYRNTEKPEELNYDKTVKEPKMDHEMKKTIIENPVETNNVNNIVEKKLHHETMDIGIVNDEEATDKYIIEAQKTQSELRNTNSKNEEDSLAMEIDETF